MFCTLVEMACWLVIGPVIGVVEPDAASQAGFESATMSVVGVRFLRLVGR